MSLTKHAKMRFQQRGLREHLINIIMAYGHFENAPGGATKVFFGRKEKQSVLHEIKNLIQMVERASGGTLIIKDNTLITVYKRG